LAGCIKECGCHDVVELKKYPDSSTAGRKAWVQQEGQQQISLTLKSHTEIIDEVKQMVFGNIRGRYGAFYR